MGNQLAFGWIFSLLLALAQSVPGQEIRPKDPQNAQIEEPYMDRATTRQLSGTVPCSEWSAFDVPLRDSIADLVFATRKSLEEYGISAKVGKATALTRVTLQTTKGGAGTPPMEFHLVRIEGSRIGPEAAWKAEVATSDGTPRMRISVLGHAIPPDRRASAVLSSFRGVGWQDEKPGPGDLPECPLVLTDIQKLWPKNVAIIDLESVIASSLEAVVKPGSADLSTQEGRSKAKAAVTDRLSGAIRQYAAERSYDLILMSPIKTGPIRLQESVLYMAKGIMFAGYSYSSGGTDITKDFAAYFRRRGYR
jgi:hypothetical protein